MLALIYASFFPSHPNFKPQKDPTLFPESRVRPWVVDKEAERKVSQALVRRAQQRSCYHNIRGRAAHSRRGRLHCAVLTLGFVQAEAHTRNNKGRMIRLPRTCWNSFS